MDKTVLITLITSIATLVTTIVGFKFQSFREKRQREWDREDRRLVARALEVKVVETASTIAEKVVVTASTLATKVEVMSSKHADRASEIKELIQENTEISKAAFTEANNVNIKLKEIGMDKNALLAEIAKEVEDYKK